MANEYTQSPLGQSISRNETLTVDASVVLVSSAQKRKSIYLRNTSAGGQVISLSFSDTNEAAAGAGIVLNPNDAIIDSTSEAYEAWNGKITAIASGAGGTLAIMERGD